MGNEEEYALVVPVKPRSWQWLDDEGADEKSDALDLCQSGEEDAHDANSSIAVEEENMPAEIYSPYEWPPESWIGWKAPNDGMFDFDLLEEHELADPTQRHAEDFEDHQTKKPSDVGFW